MKKIKYIAIISFLLVMSCAHMDVQLPDKLKDTNFSAALYVPPLPEPEAFVIATKNYPHLDSQDYLSQQIRDEALVAIKKADFRNILIETARQNLSQLKNISVKIIDNGFEGFSIDITEHQGKDTAQYFAPIEKKSATPYLFKLTVNRWEYLHYAFAEMCFFRISLTGEILDISSGKIIWRKSFIQGDKIEFPIKDCEPVQNSVKKVLSQGTAILLKQMVDDINRKEKENI